MNIVSRCCLREIIKGSYHENPLGAREYNGEGITYQMDICSCCGIEIDEPLAVTECCGEVTCDCGHSCKECNAELSETNEYHKEWGTCNSTCFGKLVGVNV